MDSDDFLKALDAAYLHGYRPKFGVDEYQEVFSILGREPTEEESQMLGEIRSEGFKKRVKERQRH